MPTEPNLKSEKHEGLSEAELLQLKFWVRLQKQRAVVSTNGESIPVQRKDLPRLAGLPPPVNVDAIWDQLESVKRRAKEHGKAAALKRRWAWAAVACAAIGVLLARDRWLIEQCLKP